MVNRCIFIGRLTRDPETRQTTTGQNVCNFSIAINERWTDKAGQKQERVEYVKVVVWGKMADSCARYLSKGSQVYVEGRLQTRQYQNKEGVTQYSTEINAESVQFLDGREAQDEPHPAPGRLPF